jgi:SAM-dependent methyltransferase
MDKYVFLASLSESDKCVSVLDVGCGNDSAFWTKQILPECHYVGIDIEDYAFEKKEFANEYYLTDSLNFSSLINDVGAQDLIETKSGYGKFDAVISAHNLEHVHDRKATLIAMCSALKKGGKIFLAFPSSKTRFFPSRTGSLNYYDDPSHTGEPPNFSETISILKQNGIIISFKARRYRDSRKLLTGIRNEYKSHRTKTVLEGTWALWGFESIIWGERA